MSEPELDTRVLAWLRDEQPGPSDWVMPAVLAHVRRHPRPPSWPRLIVVQPWAWTERRPMRRALEGVMVASLVLAGAGLLAFGAGLLPVSPDRPVPSATANPSPSASGVPGGPTPPAAIDAYREAWHSGDVGRVPDLLAPGATIAVVGPDAKLTATDFTISTQAHGSDTWERTGPFTNGGAFWAHPAWRGASAGYEGFSVYRIAGDGRISAIWVLLGSAASSGSHEAPAASTPPAVATFLDGCLDALNRRDAVAFGSCYAADGESFLAADAPAGTWTDHYAGSTHIGEAVASLGALDRFIRTGDVLVHEDMAVYAFRLSTGGACAAGIDAFLLTPDHTRIQTHWAICGPEPG